MIEFPPAGAKATAGLSFLYDTARIYEYAILMPMKHFYLLRHTEFENPDNTFHGRLPVKLAPAGREQAKRVGAWFRDKKIRVIYSSEVERCRETSKIVSGIIGVPVVYDKRLLEILTAIQGMNLAAYIKDRNIRFSLADRLGGETTRDVQIRMLDLFYEKVKDEPGNCIICSHGDGLYFLYLALMGKEIPDDVYTYDRTQYPKWGSVRCIDIDGSKITVSDIERIS